MPKPVFGLSSSTAMAGNPVVGETVLYANTNGAGFAAPRPFREYAASTPVITNRSEPREISPPGSDASVSTSRPTVVQVPAPGFNVTEYVSLSGFGPDATTRPGPPVLATFG